MPDFKIENAIMLSARQLGEKSWILSLFTKTQGRINGVLKRKQPPQIGTFINARWSARLSEQLGTFYLDEIIPFSVQYLDDSKRLMCLSSVCALLNETLPERQLYPDLYNFVFSFFEQLGEDNFLKNYVIFEKELLSEIGFGLDTSCCAGGGNADNLTYISPKTGRAVSQEVGEPYKDKLLSLPLFLWKQAPATNTDILVGLKLTGYFLTQHSMKHKLPKIREQLISSF